MHTEIVLENSKIQYFPTVFSPSESEKFFSQLQTEIAWAQEPIVMFGKKILQPRLTAYYGDSSKSYRYSGITMVPKQWTPSLLEIKNRIERYCEAQFTSVLLNFYRDQLDSMGWHRDNEKELGAEPLIASVSFGETRKFIFRNYKNKSEKKSLDLVSGSLLIMSGQTQTFWEHSIPKEKSAKDPRINLTFRIVKLSANW